MITHDIDADNTKWFESDFIFNQIYPLKIRTLSRSHWTPLNVTKAAAEFLSVEKNKRILDIGSGVGKFCLNAGFYHPETNFFGIEQRFHLIEEAEIAKKMLGLDNVNFIHGNFTQISLKEFDHFYFYNAFFENLIDNGKIDNDVHYSTELYHYYTAYLCEHLRKCPSGTRLATFHTMEDEVPNNFYHIGSAFGDLLKFWIKT